MRTNGMPLDSAPNLSQFLDRVGDEDPVTGCRLWLGRRVRYGVVYIDGKARQAHRVAFQMFVAPIPAGLNVLHRCDNPPCVNPEHLFHGTQLDNIADREAKGRTGRGATMPNTKLTPDELPDIRARLSAGESMGSIGRRHGVHAATIRDIRDGRSWRLA